jgi:hypothetical protein
MVKILNRLTFAILAYGNCALASSLHYGAGHAIDVVTIFSIAAAISAVAGMAATAAAFLAFAE